MTDEERKNVAEKMYSKYSQQFPEVNLVDNTDLQNWIRDEEKVTLVDCRKPEEIEVSRIPGAITESELDKLLADDSKDIGSQETKYVFYCTIGYRSGLAAKKFVKNGYCASERAFNSKGVLLWLHDGGELIDKEDNPVNKVHCYGKAWELAPKGVETVIF
eukprot:CAMPEP_0204830440 /NCGR_PEP_ID=MMETSP1346-20131115/8608_1 /ASSEMBLY_ACC=CAM_ASM_000771 /TAXON_ID=215587 /ORGANISM="Aplanochytrium stocchinoi, Strain GSBS06" /LENGTH=159 /DNA_ID=CAMNT_0051960685 /DNA_START=146 /DNA_END=625 /DNA_ORIENTATION=+